MSHSLPRYQITILVAQGVEVRGDTLLRMNLAVHKKAVFAIAARVLVGLVELAWIGGPTVASAQNSQPSTTVGGGHAFLAGEISVGGDISVIETKLFTCTPVQLFKKGDKIPAMLEIEQTGNKEWSISNHPLQIGTSQVAYPIAAIVTTSDGVGYALFPAVLKAKTDIEAGKMLHSDGYQIETRRAVKAGDSISVFFIIGSGAYSLLSIETAGDGKPWFSAFTDDMKLNARTSALETWQITRAHARK